MRRHGSFQALSVGVFVALVATVFVTVSRADPCYTEGVDQFNQTIGQVEVSIKGQTDHVTISGPTTIVRSSPGDNDGDGLQDLRLEIVAMQLTGVSPVFGPVTVKESSARDSKGLVEQESTAACFPAKSKLFVFVEINGIAHNDQPAEMAETINSIPPGGAVYESPPEAPVVAQLFAGPSHPEIGLPVTEEPVGYIKHARHIPIPEFPLFSIEAGSPSATVGGLDPAHIYTILSAGGPPVVAIPKQALGLGAGDDVDALSFGPDQTDLRFSVRLGSQGVLGSDVNVEASATPTEAHGDEFNNPGPGTNELFMDEGLFGLSLADDLDALAEPPPNLPVFFSLAPGSPALGLIPATPGDILVASAPGGLPTVHKDHTLLGLVASDDLDGLCNYPPPDPVFSPEIFSLAAGSPSLAAAFPALSPADLLLPGPVEAIDAFNLGLLNADDVDALKCGQMRFHRPEPSPEPSPRPEPSPTPTRCPETLPPEQDRDQDGLSNDEEMFFGTDPNNPDSDFDGLGDGAEVKTFGTDPNNPDTNANGIPDGQDDSNNNGIPDGQECPVSSAA